MRRKVVFIMGAGHCGSTLLDLLLGSHSQAFSLGELYRMNQLIGRPRDRSARICGVCVRTCDFWDQRASRAIMKLYFSRQNAVLSFLNEAGRYVYNPYRFLLRWSRKPVLIDSSKNPRWIRRQLRPSYAWYGIAPYLVYMCRDGRAVVNSYHRKYPERGIHSIAQDWKRRTEQMNQLYRQFPQDRKVTVQYEEVATQTERVMRSLCDLLGLEYERDMLSYWAHEHHHVFGNGGTRSLVFKYREKFGIDLPALRERQENSKRFYDPGFYDIMELGIQLDERWRSELSREHLEIFDAVAGDANKALAYD